MSLSGLKETCRSINNKEVLCKQLRKRGKTTGLQNVAAAINWKFKKMGIKKRIKWGKATLISNEKFLKGRVEYTSKSTIKLNGETFTVYEGKLVDAA